MSSNSSTRRLLSVLLTFTFACVAFAQDCYYPDGSLDSNTFVVDTNNVTSGAGSACCHTGDTYTNGTCVTQSSSGSFPPKVIYRPSCTSRSWSAEGCPTVCKSSTPNATTWLLPCRNPDGSACCYTDNSAPSCNCFGSGFGPPGFFSQFASGAASPTAAPSATPVGSGSGSGAETGTGTASPNAGAANSNGSAPSSADGSSGRTVGLAVGLSLGIVLLIAGVVFALYYRRHRAARTKDARPTEMESGAEGKSLRKFAELEPQSAAELPPYGGHAGAAQEMEGAGTRYELDAGGLKKDGDIRVGELDGEGRREKGGGLGGGQG